MRRRVSDFLRASGLSDRPESAFGVSPNVDWTELPGAWSVLFADEGDLRERAGSYLASGAAPEEPKIVMVQLDRDPTYWIKRSRGEPAPLPEETLSALIDRSGVRPDRSLGAFRMIYPIRERGGERWIVDSENVSLVVRLDDSAGVFESMKDARPVDFSPGSGTARVDYVRWKPVANARDGGNEDVPQTIEELLAAYLELVGIDPAECWGVLQGHAGEFFAAVIYRDASGHDAGRERFAGYCRELGVDPRAELVPVTIRMMGAHGAAKISAPR